MKVEVEDFIKKAGNKRIILQVSEDEPKKFEVGFNNLYTTFSMPKELTNGMFKCVGNGVEASSFSGCGDKYRAHSGYLVINEMNKNGIQFAVVYIHLGKYTIPLFMSSGNTSIGVC